MAVIVLKDKDQQSWGSGCPDLQVMNEKLVEQILKIAVRVGVEFQVKWVEDEKIMVVVRKEKVKEVIEKLMDGEESQGRRESQRVSRDDNIERRISHYMYNTLPPLKGTSIIDQSQIREKKHK